MFKTFPIVVVAIIAITSAGFAGRAHKGKKVQQMPLTTGEEVVQGPIFQGFYPSTYNLGPGDSIGFTTYDYGTNGSVCRNLVNYGDGTFSMARMGATVLAANTPDRGSWFSHSTDSGNTWPPLAKVETGRTGWTSIAQFVDAGGVEAVISHDFGLFDLEVNIDAAKGAGTWSSSTTGSNTLAWPRAAIGSGFTLHIVSSAGGATPTDAVYTRSQDAGTTFDILGQTLFTSPGFLPGADSYTIAAVGTNVAIVNAPSDNVTSGDVILLTSGDNGSTWTEQVIYDIAQAGELPTGQQEFQPDGAVACVYDNAGNLHVAWTNFLAIGDASNNPELFFSIDAPIMYWSAATGIVDIAPSVSDTTIQKPGNNFGNLATQPDIGVDANDNPYIVFSQQISEQDDSLLYYQHVYGVGSTDGGTTWGPPVDITPGTGFDASFPSLADLVDTDVHIIYNCDPLAGSNLRVNHPQIQVAVMYHKFLASALVTDVKELPGQVPSAYRLTQNYPNPFNPSTTIIYSVPITSFVTLKVYDILGREVATVVNGEQSVGNYAVDFQAANLSSGTYFYALKAGDFADVKKMVVLK
jgi:hypothetical protein